MSLWRRCRAYRVAWERNCCIISLFSSINALNCIQGHDSRVHHLNRASQHCQDNMPLYTHSAHIRSFRKGGHERCRQQQLSTDEAFHWLFLISCLHYEKNDFRFLIEAPPLLSQSSLSFLRHHNRVNRQLTICDLHIEYRKITYRIGSSSKFAVSGWPIHAHLQSDNRMIKDWTPA